MSASTDEAIGYLKRTKPKDGYTSEIKSDGVRLLRRNVPLTDNYFLDLHHDPATDQVVGILSSRKGRAQAQVLVDSNGKPVDKKVILISVSSYNPNGAKKNRPAESETAAMRKQNQEILKFAAYILVAMVAFRIVFDAMYVVYILIFPLAYVYAVFHCPSPQSFDVKKELKRVLRGHHLPDDHPDKPSGFLSETFARINASVQTEMATGMGYEVTMIQMAGAAYLACVRVPSYKTDFYFLGAIDRWYYLYANQLEGAKVD